MNAEALIGTMLGTCMLQKLVGQGGMGAVFLAQQSRPRRQVAVKVLLPVSSQSPQQQAAFLERFRRETDAAASLEHPNIVPVHEYGERDGLAYLVMPYISGGTLRDEMEDEKPFLLSKTMSYLDQIAAALDFAHEHGVIHRDIKPANILMTPERRLLLTDFGLVKVIAGNQGQSPNTRLTAVGAPMGTPDYMAPEQVLGGEIDSRADLYSLGIILFQMVTGKTPFRGEMPMQIAMQHLHNPPSSPREFRPDLPLPAEQVILRALAKRPQDRYSRCADLANAFRLALTASGVPLGDTQQGLPMYGNMNEIRSFTRRSLFDPMWQGGASSAGNVASSGGFLPQASPAGDPIPTSQPGYRNDIVAKTSMTMPSFSGFFETPTRAMPQANAPLAQVEARQMTPLPETALPNDSIPVEHRPPAAERPAGPPTLHGLHLGRKSLLRPLNDELPTSSAPSTQQQEELHVSGIPPAMLAAMGSQADTSGAGPAPVQPTIERPQPLHPKTLAGLSGRFADGIPQHSPLEASPEQGNPGDLSSVEGRPPADEPFSNQQQGPAATRALQPMSYDGQGMTGMIKLTQPMKIVKVPVAGKPGTFITGLLPMSPEIKEDVPPPLPLIVTQFLHRLPPENLQFVQKNAKKLVLVALATMFLLGSGGIWLALSHSSPSANYSNGPSVTISPGQATAYASATAQEANIILEDSLSTNIHSWKENTTGNQTFVFKDGKYHVAINNGNSAALADLPDEVMPDSFVFSVDASEIKGDDTSVNNQFGLVFRLNQAQKDGQPWVTFYCFQVQNARGALQYQLRKYDSSYADDAEKWSTPWSGNVGKEYRFGHGPSATNTIKVVVNGSQFAFVVNGKTVGSFKDSSFKAGRVGLLVNQQGTEVAFSNLLLTHN